jgi:hypothetical protein
VTFDPFRTVKADSSIVRAMPQCTIQVPVVVNLAILFERCSVRIPSGRSVIVGPFADLIRFIQSIAFTVDLTAASYAVLE